MYGLNFARIYLKILWDWTIAIIGSCLELHAKRDFCISDWWLGDTENETDVEQ